MKALKYLAAVLLLAIACSSCSGERWQEKEAALRFCHRQGEVVRNLKYAEEEEAAQIACGPRGSR